MRSPLTGLIASAPSATPVFSRSVESRSISVRRRACSTYAGRPRLGPGGSGGPPADAPGEDHEGRAEQRVRAGREDPDAVAARLMIVGRDLEVDLGAFRATDPVGLLRLDRLRPVDPREVEQLVRIARRAQEPLLQVALSRPARRSASSAGPRPRPARGPACRRWGTSRRRTSPDRPGRPPGSAGTATGSSGSRTDRR